VDAPVSLLGLARGIERVLNGSVKDSSGFVDSVVADDVLSFVDGPTWDVDRLYDEYDPETVDKVRVRKVGVVRREAMTVYESGWGDASVQKVEYDLTDHTRSMVERTRRATPPEEFRGWLVSGVDNSPEAEVSKRLERLGYK
jgi:hypothetical protein